MSKKSYKRNQNRLYREIKRRIIAEQALKFPVKFPAPVIEIHRDIETLAVRNIVPNYLVREIEFVKTEMANKLARKLVAEGWSNLVYLPKAGMFADDFEGTVDGVHPNDWGAMSLARAYGKAVKTALGLDKREQ